MFQLLEDLFGHDGRFTAIDAACGPAPSAGACSNASRRRGGGAGRRRHAAGDRAYGAGRLRRTGPRGGVRPHRSRLDRTGRRSARVPRRRTARGAALPPRCTGCRPPNSPGSTPRPANCSPRRRAAERRPHALRPTLAGTRGIVPEAPRAGPPGFRGQRRGQLGRLVATRRADPRLAPLKAQRDAHFARRPLRRQRRRRLLARFPSRRPAPGGLRRGRHGLAAVGQLRGLRPPRPGLIRRHPGTGNTSNGTRAIRRTLTQINAGSASLARIHNILLF